MKWKPSANRGDSAILIGAILVFGLVIYSGTLYVTNTSNLVQLESGLRGEFEARNLTVVNATAPHGVNVDRDADYIVQSNSEDYVEVTRNLAFMNFIDYAAALNLTVYVFHTANYIWFSAGETMLAVALTWYWDFANSYGIVVALGTITAALVAGALYCAVHLEREASEKEDDEEYEDDVDRLDRIEKAIEGLDSRIERIVRKQMKQQFGVITDET